LIVPSIRFDDFAALQGFIGEDFGPWGPEIVVTQAMIDSFADLTGDRRWLHIDPERARRESPFGATVAHGFLTLSLLPALDPGDIEITGYSSLANYGAKSLRFLGPVRADSRVHAHVRLSEAVPHPKGSLLTFAMAIHIVGEEKPVLAYEAQVLYWR
jgi:acyl dehydratase